MPYAEGQRTKLLVEVEQLRVHLAIERSPVSKSAADMIRYCEQNILQDPLYSPFKENPFKEKKGCTIL